MPIDFFSYYLYIFSYLYRSTKLSCTKLSYIGMELLKKKKSVFLIIKLLCHSPLWSLLLEVCSCSIMEVRGLRPVPLPPPQLQGESRSEPSARLSQSCKAERKRIRRAEDDKMERHRFLPFPTLLPRNKLSSKVDNERWDWQG